MVTAAPERAGEINGILVRATNSAQLVGVVGVVFMQLTRTVDGKTELDPTILNLPLFLRILPLAPTPTILNNLA